MYKINNGKLRCTFMATTILGIAMALMLSCFACGPAQTTPTANTQTQEETPTTKSEDAKDVTQPVSSAELTTAQTEPITAPPTTTQTTTTQTTTTTPTQKATSSTTSKVSISASSTTSIITTTTKESQKTTTVTTTTTTKGNISAGKSNALRSAQQYLAAMPFSYQGLIDQLIYEKYTREQATYGVDNIDANWNEQAVKTAQNYLKYSSFSRSGLIDQLVYEGVTNEQAVYGVDNCGVDW